MDIFTKAKRSDVMSRIRGGGNKNTELRLMQIFRAIGITPLRTGSDETSRLAHQTLPCATPRPGLASGP